MEHHAEHVATIAELVWPIANFTIFVALLVNGLRGPVREFLRARTERLREELEAGDRARREAKALRIKLAKDLAALPAVQERLKADLRATAARERDQMLAQSRQTADRIRTDAKLLAEQEMASARRVLRNEVVEKAIAEASTLVRGTIEAPDQVRFVRDFIGSAEVAS